MRWRAGTSLNLKPRATPGRGRWRRNSCFGAPTQGVSFTRPMFVWRRGTGAREAVREGNRVRVFRVVGGRERAMTKNELQ